MQSIPLQLSLIIVIHSTSISLIFNLFKISHAVVKAPKLSHTTHILKSLHWLKINECINYKLLSLTYKVLTTTEPSLSLFNPIATLVPPLLSPFLDHLHL